MTNTPQNSTRKNIKFHSPEEMIEDIRQGKMVLLVDDEDRENEGDLVLAADHVTPESVSYTHLTLPTIYSV